MGREGLAARLFFGLFFLMHQKEVCLPTAYLFLVDVLKTQCATSKTTEGVAGKDYLRGNAGFL